VIDNCDPAKEAHDPKLRLDDETAFNPDEKVSTGDIGCASLAGFSRSGRLGFSRRGAKVSWVVTYSVSFSRFSRPSFSAGCFLSACGSGTSNATSRRSGRSESACWTGGGRRLHERRYSDGACGQNDAPLRLEAVAPGGGEP
jgi:hypothetical protein